ncbi:MAG: glycosyltransferase [Sphingobacteriaceae bacterium]|nr:MAG: glycosyltransferase [Sphingobacteriaceae bacterium]
MKILFILPEYYPHSGGGISTYYEHYIKALLPHCDEIKVIVGSGYTQADNNFKHNGVLVEYLSPILYRQYLDKFTQYDLLPEYKNSLASAWAMWHQANQGQDYDIVECTDFGLGFIPWVIEHNKPVITRLHGSYGQVMLHENDSIADLSIPFTQQTELLTLKLCDKLVTHSKANSQYWDNLFGPNITRHINPIYEKIGSPLPLSQRDKYGLITARIQKWKGPIELCKAHELLTDQPLIKWFGHDKAYNKYQSTDSYLREQFASIWGKSILPQQPLPNNEIQALQQKAWFGVIPSTWDMFNFTCIEFMAAGTPIICSDGAGAGELIQNGINGFKYPADNVQALADCITKMTGLSEDGYHQMAKNALETIKTQLSADKLIPINMEVYQSAVNDFKSAPSNPFLDSLYKPSSTKYDIGNILNKQPLKKLINYSIDRIKLKISGKR